MAKWNLTGGMPAPTGQVDHEVDPISRIEGHLGIKVRVDEDEESPTFGKILDANAHGNLWRGFENFLLGRAVNDAITFTQRICGVCPVPHGMTATHAADTVLGYSRGHITFSNLNEAPGTYGVPPKALLIRNLVLSAEMLMSSITHFYHLAAPSYVQGPKMPPWTPYFADEQYAAALVGTATGSVAATAGVIPDANASTMKLWDAVIISYVRALKIRRLTFEAAALFAGRMPMTSCYVGGGVTNDATENLTAKANKFLELIRTVGEFIFREYVPIVLALGALYPEFDNTFNQPTVGGSGAGVGRFLSWGAYPELTDDLGIWGGVVDTNAGGLAKFQVKNKTQVESVFLSGPNSVPANLTEDIANARYAVASVDTAAYAEYAGKAAYPGKVARTKPNRATGYTYSKAPRWAGKPCEVGPFARMVVNDLYPVDGTVLSAHLLPHYAKYLLSDGETFNANAIASTIAAGLKNTNADGTTPAVPGAGTALNAVVNYILGCKGGLSTMDRLRARGLESLVLVQKMVGNITMNNAGELGWDGEGWIGQLKARTGTSVLDVAGSTWVDKPIPVGVKEGWGACEVPRGALMHQCTVQNGKITKYQCIVPTTWNMSPKDAAGQSGPMEKACIGASFMPGDYTVTGSTGEDIETTKGGVEVLRIAQSFDPCIACAIH